MILPFSASAECKEEPPTAPKLNLPLEKQNHYILVHGFLTQFGSDKKNNNLNRSLLQIKERRTEAQRSTQKPVPMRCSTRVLSGRQHAQSPCDYWQLEETPMDQGSRTNSQAGRRFYGTIFWEE